VCTRPVISPADPGFPNTGWRSAGDHEATFVVDHLVPFLSARFLVLAVADGGRPLIIGSASHDPAMTPMPSTALEPRAFAYPSPRVVAHAGTSARLGARIVRSTTQR
jgi:hypothetical protein